MLVYVGKDSELGKTWPQPMRQWQLTNKVQGRGHKLYMDNYFTFPVLFDDLATKQIYCCGTVKSNRKGMPQDLGPQEN
jgi:hypothetical protein